MSSEAGTGCGGVVVMLSSVMCRVFVVCLHSQRHTDSEHIGQQRGSSACRPRDRSALPLARGWLADETQGRHRKTTAAASSAASGRSGSRPTGPVYWRAESGDLVQTGAATSRPVPQVPRRVSGQPSGVHRPWP